MCAEADFPFPSLDWIDVPAGSYVRGGGPRSNENPAREIFISGFRLARAPVTRQLYQAFLDDAGRPAPPCWQDPAFAHPSMPAVGPSWNDAQVFCAWIGQSTWRGEVVPAVRLPTEAEWERAAKGNRDVTYPWGEDRPESLPDYSRRWQDGPEPVDAYPSLHPWGFLGLGENVHEWCSDCYDADYYAVSPDENPGGPEHGRRKSSRGGAWRHAIKVSRCAARSSIPPQMSYSDYGFRLAADPPRS